MVEKLQHHDPRHCGSVCSGVSVGQAGSRAGSGHRPHMGCKGGKLLCGAGTPRGSQEGTPGAFVWAICLYAGLVHSFLLLEAWRGKELTGTRAREEDSWIAVGATG